MKQILTVVISLIAAVAIVVFLPVLTENISSSSYQGNGEESVLAQSIERVESTPHEIHEIYESGHLIGVLSDVTRLNNFLKQVYQVRYAEEYPDSECALGKDVYMTSSQSYFTYENIDDQIFKYLSDQNLFTLKATGVEFSDENGIYAEIYVLNQKMYEDAMQTYISYFIDPADLVTLNSGQQTAELRTYGSRAVGISIAQTITTKEAYASPDEIKTSSAQVLDYLEYGDNTEKQYYTVQKYDTVAGVGSKNFGLSATQVMNINRDQISSIDQVLTEGMKLCVTYFNSPIEIDVNMETMRKETIYPETIYQEDETIREGETVTKQAGVNGSKNVLYSEKWINGVLVSGSEVSSVDVLQPVNEIIAVGTLEVPGVGTGEFRWPVDNPYISCYWGCYYGHQAIDIQNKYNHYGNLYAADRGVIEVNGYNSVNGNYVVINHNNGYETYYGHMNVPSPLAVGTVVDKGDIIGQLGMTGAATGPHTHFFIIENGERKNPCEGFLDCSAI